MDGRHLVRGTMSVRSLIAFLVFFRGSVFLALRTCICRCRYARQHARVSLHIDTLIALLDDGQASSTGDKAGVHFTGQTYLGVLDTVFLFAYSFGLFVKYACTRAVSPCGDVSCSDSELD